MVASMMLHPRNVFRVHWHDPIWLPRCPPDEYYYYQMY